VIGIVDFDMGNIGSIANMMKYLQAPYCLVRKAADMAACHKLILPGVGAFDTAVTNLHRQDLWQPLQAFATEHKKPVLGICLGMQLMCNHSEEGSLPGLGWIDAPVQRFQFDESIEHLRIPHMGWNKVEAANASFALFQELPLMRFYFVHAYYVPVQKKDFEMGITHYGHPFVSVVGLQNVMGFQCHPEKSHRYGMQVYRNFIALS
jgi:glutamine amidotransferase